jgi:Transposase IS116/IS110/IS902 family
VPAFSDRELKERLGRRMHLIRLRTSAMNRAHGVLSQFGVKLAFDRLRPPDAMVLLAERGVPEVWRRSVGEAVAIVRVLNERLIPVEHELRPIARADPRVALLVTIPGIGDLLGMTIASEIGDISRFASARKLVGYSGLTPRVYQSGERSRTGKLSGRARRCCAGPRSRPPSRHGARTAPGTSSISTSRPAAAARATRPRPPSPARSSPRRGTRSRCTSPSAPRARAARKLLSRRTPVAFWPTETAHKELSSRDSSDRHGVRGQAPKEN